jgi:indolepyruvate ferredoxin oxidoreductase
MAGAFRLLTRFKGLRGTPLDVFGYTEERRSERALIDSYRASIEEVITSLSAANHTAAIELARIPEQIKGYGHVKERHLLAARKNWAALSQAFRNAS